MQNILHFDIAHTFKKLVFCGLKKDIKDHNKNEDGKG